MAKKLFSIIFFTIFLLAENQPSPTISIAVYPLKAKGKCDPSLGSALTSLLIYNLSQSSRFKVIEEETLKLVFERQGMNASDLCDSTVCQVEIGKLVQAQKIVVGELIKMGEKFVLILRIIDIEKGTVDYSVQKDCYCPEDQLDKLSQVTAINIRNHYGENLPEPTFTFSSPLPGNTSIPSTGAPQPSVILANLGLPKATPEQEAAFRDAIKSSRLNEIQELLEKTSGLLNTRFEDGRVLQPPIIMAAEQSSIEVIKLLLDKGADINVQNNYGETALHYAAWKCRGDVIRLLVSKGAKVNIQDNRRIRPLYPYTFNGPCIDDDTKKFLISHGAMK